MAIKRSLQDITRKESSDAITSPDQLDQLMVVTRARGWITLLVIGLILALGIGWSIIGKINRNIDGMGMLLPTEGPILVQAKASGQLVEFGFKDGDTVNKGDVIARINDDVAKLQLNDLQKQYDALEKIHHNLDALEDTQLKLAIANRDEQISGYKNSIAETKVIVELQKEQLKAEKELLDSGLVSKQQWIQTQQTLTSLTTSITQNESQIKIAELSYQQAVSTTKQQYDLRTMQLLSQEAKIQETQARNKQDHLIVAPADGTIMETRFDLSNIITVGSNVFELLPSFDGQETCIAYVDATLGKRIEVGMTALVSPSISKPTRYGYITGKVVEVGSLIASRATIQLTYENELFVQQIVQQFPAPIKLVIELDKDDSTPSGYAWTSTLGYPHKIHIGTITNIKIEYTSERPIELFLPWLKKVFLGAGDT